MRLGAENGNSFEFSIVGYQFPDADEMWDANWLLIRVDVRTEDAAWCKTDPCLLTADVAALADWLEDPEGELAFMEPNLAFECLERDGSDARLRVWFELESRPDWAPSRTAGERDVKVELRVP